MKTYLVTWAMEFQAISPEDAAQQALDTHRDRNSIATCFTVYDTEGPDDEAGTEVDLMGDDKDD